ncbi:MAG: nuclear transport factor 2 family protein [Actinomycetota bacterium]
MTEPAPATEAEEAGPALVRDIEVPDAAEADVREAMRELKRGFARADREALTRAVTDDFEWHLHWFDGDDDRQTGHVLRGIDEVMAEIQRRSREWTELHYADVEERYTEDLVVQTFVVSGVDGTGRRFHHAAVDLYPIRNGRIAAKRTYWKQPTAGTD